MFNTVLAESSDLLAVMEDAILQIERDGGDREAIAALFRAAHTIKGSAGLFDLNAIVAFAHALETVLDRVRSGELAVDVTLIALLLDCTDQLGAMLAQLTHASDRDPVAIDERALALQVRLSAYTVPHRAAPADAAGPAPALPSPAGADAVVNDAWHVSIRLCPDVMRRGLDPQLLLRELGTLGRTDITTVCDRMPPAPEMDPECCYLGFEARLWTEAPAATIEAIFEFVRDDSCIRLLPPHCALGDYRELLQALPEGATRGGEILQACGALTATERARITVAAPAATPRGDAPCPLPRGEAPERKDAALVRVDAQKLEDLINDVGEMLITSASATLLASAAGTPELQETMGLLNRMVERIRDRTLALRMVEIGDTFRRFQRVVRDVSRELGKDIRLEIAGEDAELDKTVVEKIRDPLTHLVRNAIDHGIEPPEVRRAAGKPPAGTVKLTAYHESGSIVIEVADDGRGLDRDRILRKAVECGLVEPGRTLSDKQVYALIFEPGLSTAEQVSDLSGRGVGMDVVRRNIEALRGSIDVRSRSGHGTRIRIRLPLTLAIIDGFLVEIAGRQFVLPLDIVVECLEMPSGARRATVELGYLELRGEVLACRRLRELLAIGGSAPKSENIVVVRCGGGKAGLVVDRLRGELQTVIKPLGPLLRNQTGIAGSTILGSGEVALIVDAPALLTSTTPVQVPADAGSGTALQMSSEETSPCSAT
ncbi:MAG: chemotaxis protein CheA [Gammaproteobacteria bacterium]